ncbi:hypothetical protein R3P38DRAFT_2775178 [Favolaschia claudopus]|uniref:Uncharacterized protein n=1 Tax=Favolaschia claudopus TaxID=2862362 RepID=A0AAW0BQW0_9AGAR
MTKADSKGGIDVQEKTKKRYGPNTHLPPGPSSENFPRTPTRTNCRTPPPPESHRRGRRSAGSEKDGWKRHCRRRRGAIGRSGGRGGGGGSRSIAGILRRARRRVTSSVDAIGGKLSADEATGRTDIMELHDVEVLLNEEGAEPTTEKRQTTRQTGRQREWFQERWGQQWPEAEANCRRGQSWGGFASRGQGRKSLSQKEGTRLGGSTDRGSSDRELQCFGGRDSSGGEVGKFSLMVKIERRKWGQYTPG